MNAIADQKALLAEALLAESGADAAAPRAPWAESFRAAAAERFRAMGAPVRRDEYWRYTDPARLTQPLPAAAPGEPSGRAGPLAAIDAVTLTFVNGRFRADLSDAPTLGGVEILTLAEALADPNAPAWVTDRLGALETAGHRPVERPMAALNGALAADGVLIRATGAAERPIHLNYQASGEGAAHTRSLVVVEPGAALTLLESGAGAQRFNAVLEADVADGAVLNHVRSLGDPATDQVFAGLFARLGANARLKSFAMRASAFSAAVEAPISRNEAMVWLTGLNGSAHLAGGVLGRAGAHADNTVFLTHDAEDCESRQVFKTVLGDDARGVFQGKILVTQQAQRTDGYQISQSVLLSDHAEFDAKPELEIYADDVKCSHGSTTGAIDETAMFYLRSRGVDAATAEALLVAAFLEEAIEEIDADAPGGEAVREAMRAVVAAWMAERSAALAADKTAA